MNKKQLIEKIAKKATAKKRDFKKTDAEFALNTVIACFMDSLAKGDSITLPGFASFAVKKRKARSGRNPATGRPLSIPACNVISFKTGSKLKAAINGKRA